MPSTFIPFSTSNIEDFKKINSDLSEPLNYLHYIKDLQDKGKASYIYKRVNAITDLAANSNVVLTAEIAITLLLSAIVDADAHVGEFFKAVTKNETSAFDTLATYDDVKNNATAIAIIENNARATLILNSYSPGFRYGFRITKSEPDPLTRVEYIHDAVGKSPANMNFSTGQFNYGSWQTFCEEINRPVMLNYNGSIAYEMDRGDQTKKADGSPSDVSNTSFAGNAMAEFKKLYVHRHEDATHEYVIFSNVKYDENYLAHAHTDALGNEKDAFYFAMYEGTFVSDRLRSIATGTIMTSQTSTTEINRATTNGAGWYITTKSQWDFINDLLTLISKSTNSQASFGNGNSNSANFLSAGASKDKGQFFGASNEMTAVKTFYVENLWGNHWKRMAGLLLAIDGSILVKMTGPYPLPSADSVDITGFINTGVVPSGASGGFTKDSKFNNGAGYVPVSTSGGSATTYHACGLWYAIGSTIKVALVGGSRSLGALCGGRTVGLIHPASHTSSSHGASLSFL